MKWPKERKLLTLKNRKKFKRYCLFFTGPQKRLKKLTYKRSLFDWKKRIILTAECPLFFSFDKSTFQCMFSLFALGRLRADIPTVWLRRCLERIRRCHVYWDIESVEKKLLWILWICRIISQKNIKYHNIMSSDEVLGSMGHCGTFLGSSKWEKNV